MLAPQPCCAVVHGVKHSDGDSGASSPSGYAGDIEGGVSDGYDGDIEDQALINGGGISLWHATYYAGVTFLTIGLGDYSVPWCAAR